MKRIPYPIPEPDRTCLIEAGKAVIMAIGREEPVTQQRKMLKEIIDGIRAKYGIEEGETA